MSDDLVKRYSSYNIMMLGDSGNEVSTPDGEWVKYKDYKAQSARIEELEAKLAKAVEDLEWQANAINNSVTVNMKHNHRILLDGVYHEGPLVDWVHKILTGFEAINRTTLAKLKEETDE